MPLNEPSGPGLVRIAFAVVTLRTSTKRVYAAQDRGLTSTGQTKPDPAER
jgi:hypothetical protein